MGGGGARLIKTCGVRGEGVMLSLYCIVRGCLSG